MEDVRVKLNPGLSWQKLRSSRRRLFLLYDFFWVIPQRLEFIRRRFGTLCSIFIGICIWRWNRNNLFFGTLCLFHLHRHLPMKTEQRECFETSEYKIQTPGNYPEESIQYSEQDESLKSRTIVCTKHVQDSLIGKNWWENVCILLDFLTYVYRGADKSLARPGRKQATATEDFEFHIPYL